MRVVVFTQDERVYLPIAFEPLLAALSAQVACIVLSPPMSTHGGLWTGLRKHLPVFGVRGTLTMMSRMLATRILPSFGVRPRACKFWSIEEMAQQYGIPVYHIDKVNSDEMLAVIAKHPGDLLASVSCPQIIRSKILARFRCGGINVHSGPLPKYRGLMPAFWVLYHGATETAVTVHELADHLDNGAILRQEAVKISDSDTWDTLVRKTKRQAGQALVTTIREIKQGRVQSLPNRDEDSTYYSFPTSSDAREFRRRGKRMF